MYFQIKYERYNMSIVSKINNTKGTAFSFELLPPLKGNGVTQVFNTIEQLLEFDPQYINITTHRSELIYKESSNGLFERMSIRNRPGTVAVAAAIKNKYDITVVPHILCSGFTKEETEYVLIDLKFLGINDLLLLRGDKAKHEKNFVATGHAYATELQAQVNQFNAGYFLDGVQMKHIDESFDYGMACYPEKHEEAPNMDTELYWAKKKVEQGASYLVTQMFFDNQKYFNFVNLCRENGITVPIIPGLKPITVQNQLTILPKIFKSEIPEDFANELRKCKDNEQVAQVGIEWCVQQSKELIRYGVPSIHFYTLMATKSVKAIARQIY